MALSARHLAWATLLTCLAIAVARLPPPPDPVETRFAPPREPAPSRRRVLMLRAEIDRARRQLDVAGPRGRRLNALIAAARPGRPPTLITEVPLNPSMRGLVEQRLGVLWRRLGTPSADVGVVVVISNFGRVVQVLPSATGGTACVVELPLGWRVRWLRLSPDDVPSRAADIDDWLGGAIGPCGFYGTFGRPGPHIEQWLSSRSFDLAWANWTAPDPPTARPPDALLRAMIPMAWGGDDRYDASLDAVACNAGDRGRCRAALFAPPRQPRVERHTAPGVVMRSWRTVPSLYGAERYLADLVLDVGPERFAAFWRSPLPVADAFAHAMRGERTIEDWTAGWQRARMGALPVGAAVRLPSVLLGLVVAAFAVGVVAIWARRRQVA